MHKIYNNSFHIRNNKRITTHIIGIVYYYKIKKDTNCNRRVTSV